MGEALTRYYRKLQRTSLRRNIFWSSLLGSLLVLGISSVSALSLVLVTFDSAEFPFVGSGLTTLPAAWALIIGTVLGGLLVLTLFYLRLLSNDMYEALSEPWTRERKGATWTFVIIVSLVFVLPALIHFYMGSITDSPYSAVRTWSWAINYFTKYTGGLVGFTLAVLSILAFYITIQQLKDFQSRISSFSELLDRIIVLGQTATNDDKMHIIAYTPAVGYLAQNKLWSQVLAALTDVDKRGDRDHRCRTKILTQEMTTLTDWHAQFIGRKTKRIGGRPVTEEDVKKATKEARTIRDLLTQHDPKAYKEVKFNTLPGYYCFFTSRRAIIVAPLFLPLTATTEAPRDLAKLRAMPPPHMIGFETTDRGIIDYLFDQFEYIEQSDAGTPAEATLVAVA